MAQWPNGSGYVFKCCPLSSNSKLPASSAQSNPSLLLHILYLIPRTSLFRAVLLVLILVMLS